MREGEDERTDKPSSVDCVPFGFSAQARAEHGAGVLLGAVQGDGEGQEYDQPRDHRTKVAMHGLVSPIRATRGDGANEVEKPGYGAAERRGHNYTKDDGLGKSLWGLQADLDLVAPVPRLLLQSGLLQCCGPSQSVGQWFFDSPPGYICSFSRRRQRWPD